MLSAGTILARTALSLAERTRSVCGLADPAGEFLQMVRVPSQRELLV